MSDLVADQLYTAVELDFKTKQHRKLRIDEVASAMEAEKFVWIDVDISQAEEARKILTKLGLCAPELV